MLVEYLLFNAQGQQWKCKWVHGNSNGYNRTETIRDTATGKPGYGSIDRRDYARCISDDGQIR